MAEPLLQLTPAAVERIRHLLATRGGEDAVGLKIGVKSTGCSGLTYKLDFARDVADGDRVVEADGVKVVIDRAAAEMIAGTELDFVEDRLGASFAFRNPNEKSRCGCGESFSV